MTIQASTLRPGLLVALKSNITGNVKYAKTVIEADKQLADGARVAKWETERTITDAIEHEAATKIRSKARSLISAVCVQSAFGLLCPEDRGAELENAIIEARALTEEFNKTANITRINVYVMAGRIAPDDAEAVRAINSEIGDLFSTMEQGLASLDVERVRAAASRAKNVGQMLSPQAQERVKTAVEMARQAARRIVEAGDTGAKEIDELAIKRIAEARTLFLDLDMPAMEVEAPVAAQGRAVDLEPEVGHAPEIKAMAAAAAQIEA